MLLCNFNLENIRGFFNTFFKIAVFLCQRDLSAFNFGQDVYKRQGNTLPSTGGMGTTLFYVVGGILVIGAAAILILRKRASDNK